MTTIGELQAALLRTQAKVLALEDRFERHLEKLLEPDLERLVAAAWSAPCLVVGCTVENPGCELHKAVEAYDARRDRTIGAA